MNRLSRSMLALVLSATLAASAFGASKKYQVTGKVIELTDTVITVDKAGEKFEIDRDKDTKVEGELKVGAKVTVYYYMTAASVEVK